MEMKKVGFFIEAELHDLLKEMASKRRISQSRLISKWIKISYEKYNQKMTESQHENMDKDSGLGG